MKREYWVVGIVVFIIIGIAVGFVIGIILPETAKGCTEMWCPCEGVVDERPCNTCRFSDSLFITGLLDVIQECGASEIIVCENNVAVDTRIDLENKTCRTDWYVFGFNLRYLGVNLEETVEKQIV